jgi:hypothetical protein
LGIEQEDAGIGDPPVSVLLGNTISSVLLVHLLVEQAEITNHLASLVREQCIGNAVFFSKAVQHLDWIVANGKNGNVLALEVR